MVEQDKLSWIVDSGSTNHVCSCLQMLESTKQLEQGEMTIRVGSGALVSAKACGTVRLNFKNNFLVLNNVLFIP